MGSGENAWLFNMNHSSVPAAMREDLTDYTPGGERKAFALSLADLMQVSGPGRAFPTRESRTTPDNLR